MKKIFTYLPGFFIFTLIIFSCRKESHNEKRQQVEPTQVLNATVPSGQTYVLNVGAGSTVSIDKQASHYQRSEVAAASDGSTVYQYAASKGYAGADEVSLLQTTTSTSPGGGCSGGSSEYTTTTIRTIVIKFDVAN